MQNGKLTVLLGLTTLALAGCPGEDDSSDTGAMTMTSPTSDTNETEEPTGDSADPTGDPTTSEPETTTGPDETTGGSDPMTTTGNECTPDDECQTAADCPNPTTDMCLGCLCVDGKEPPSSSDYGPCDMCAPGETPTMIEMIEGCFCSPGCDGAMSMCPDPNEGMGTAVCALGPPMGDPVQCALLCPFGMDGYCPTGATCQDTGMMDPMGTPIGICTHPAG